VKKISTNIVFVILEIENAGHYTPFFRYKYPPPTLIRPPQIQLKTGLIGGMVSLKGDKLVVFHYLSASRF
jgi:hypothetical protein